MQPRGIFRSITVLLWTICILAAPPAARARQGGSSSPDKDLSTVLGGDDVHILDFGPVFNEVRSFTTSMASATNGDLFVAVSYDVEVNFASDYTMLEVYRSDNGGQDWVLWGSLSGLATGERYTYPSLVVAEGAISRCYLAYVSTVSGSDRREVRLVQADLTAGALSFTSPQVVFSQAGRWCQRPELVSDAASFNSFYLYMTFSSGTDFNKYGGDIWFTRSTDQGASFAAPYIVAANSDPNAYNGNPHVVHGFGDFVHLTWSVSAATDGSHDSAIRYRRAPSGASGGLSGWDPTQDLSSTSDGFNDGAYGIEADPGGNTVGILYDRANTSGAEVAMGVFASTDQGTSFSRQVANLGSGFGGGLHRQPGTGIWYIGGSASRVNLQDSAPNDLTTWNWIGQFGEIDFSRRCRNMSFVFSPTHGDRVATAWIERDSLSVPLGLRFNAEWLRDPGHPVTEPGFPVTLTAAPKAAPAVVDLDGDGNLEIVFTDTANRIQAYDHDGSVHPGFPIVLQEALSTGPVAIGDLNNGGKPTLVVGTVNGRVYAFGPTGSAGPFWSYDTLSGQPAYVSIGHLAPPYARVVAVTSGQAALFLNGAGNLAYNSVVALFDGVLDHPAVFGDVDNDGVPEIVVSSGGRLWNWNLGGIGFDVTLSGAPAITGTISLGDLDQDGDQEIIVPTAHGQLFVLQGDGSVEPGWPILFGSGALTSAAVGQLLGTSAPEIAVASRNSSVDVRFANGAEGSGWPQATGSGWFILGMPLIGTLEGLSPDVVTGARDSQGWAWDNFGGLIGGWPKGLSDPVNVAPAMGDIDQDGSQEVVFLTDTQMWVEDVHQSPGYGITWPMAGHDARRSGCADCVEDVVTAVGDGGTAGTRISFAAPAPNPSLGNTLFNFSIPQEGVVTLEVYDLRGRLVRRIERSEFNAGPHVLGWDGRDGRGHPASSGTYIAGLTVRGPGMDAHLQRKVTLMR